MATTRLMALHVGKGRNVGTAILENIGYVENPENRSRGKLPESAILQKSRSRAKGAFRGFGKLPNKRQNADRRVSGNPRFAHLWPIQTQDALLAAIIPNSV